MRVSGGIHITLAEQPKGIYLLADHTSISKLKDGSTIPSSPFTVVARGVEIDVHTIDFSLEGAPYVPVLPSGVSIVENIVTINPSLTTFKTLSIRAVAEGEDFQATLTIVVVEDGQDGEKGDKGDKGDDGTSEFKYLIPVDWLNTTRYRMTPVGIPIVRVEDGTALGFSVYSLKQDLTENEVGKKPGSSTWSWSAFWELMSSQEYLYIQESYIERLQAELITAQKIESLLIRTGNLEVIDGAKIAGLDIQGEVLVSQNKRLVVDGVNNTIYLLDENMNIKTTLTPHNLPETVSQYFSGAGGGTSSLTNLKGTITTHNGVRNSQNVFLSVIGGRMYEANIPSLTLRALVNYTPPAGVLGSAQAVLSLYLTNGTTEMGIGTAIAMSTGGSVESDPVQTLPATRIITTGGNWRLMARLSVTSINGVVSGTGTISGTPTSFPINEVVNRSEIGSNGMMIATSAQNYTFMVGGVFESRRGVHGIQITNSGVKKFNGTSWVNVNW